MHTKLTRNSTVFPSLVKSAVSACKYIQKSDSLIFHGTNSLSPHSEWTYGICGAYIYQDTNDDQSLKVTKEACYIEKIQYCRYFNNVGPKVPKPEIPAGILDPKCPTTYTPKTLNAPAPPATPAKPETPAVAAEPEAPAAPADPAVPEVPTVPATPAEPAAPAAPAAPRN